MILKNDVIELRTPEITDVDLIQEWENNPAIWRLSGTLVPFNRFQIEQYVMNSSADIFVSRQIRFIITGKGNPLGTVDLFDYDPVHLRAGVGILIATENDRRKGIATSALSLLEKYAVEILHLHQLFCSIEKNNISSIRLFESSGFIRCGTRKDWLKTTSGWEDELLFQKILED